MNESKVVMVGGSSGIGRLLAEKMRVESVGLVVTVAPRSEVTTVDPIFCGMKNIDPSEHDRKCWKDAKRYWRK